MFGHIAQRPQKMVRSRRGRARVLLHFKRLQRRYGLFFVKALRVNHKTIINRP